MNETNTVYVYTMCIYSTPQNSFILWLFVVYYKTFQGHWDSCHNYKMFLVSDGSGLGVRWELEKLMVLTCWNNLY